MLIESMLPVRRMRNRTIVTPVTPGARSHPRSIAIRTCSRYAGQQKFGVSTSMPF
jgi:hypothetical protein